MTKDMVLTRIAAIVSALGETSGTPESMLYIFCDMNMEDYSIIRDVLLRAKLITIKANFVTLTLEGKETAAKLNQLMKSEEKREQSK